MICGEPRSLSSQCGKQVVSPFFVLAAEDFVEDEERAFMDIMELGKVPGECDSQRYCDVILFAATEPVDGIIGIDVPDTEVEIIVEKVPVRTGHL